MVSASPQPEDSSRTPLWRLRDSYRGLTPLQRRAVLFVLALTAVLAVAMAGVMLTLRLLVFPQIERYKGHIEQMAGKAVGGGVEIARIETSWDGINPRLDLDEVTVRDREGRTALSLPRVSATISWKSLPAGELRLASLELLRPDLDIRRETDGKLVVAGIAIDQGKTDGKAGDWLLQQDEIVIREGRLHWTDRVRGAPELVLEQVDFALRNRWRHHRFGLRAVPPSALASPVEINADFVHPYFAHPISDVMTWKGELSVDLAHTDLAAWKRYLDYPFEIQRGLGAVSATLHFDRARIADFTADVGLSDVAARLGKDLPLLQLRSLVGRLSAREDFDASDEDDDLPFGDRAHAIMLSKVSLQTEDGIAMPETTFSESFMPGIKGAPGRTEIRASQLDLSTLSKLAQYLPLSKDVRGMLADFAPSGQLSDFAVQWQGAYPDLVSYTVNGNFSGLSMKGQPPRPARPKEGKRPAQAAVPGIPGFDNLSGSVTASERGGRVSLDSSHSKLQLPGYISQSAVPFEQLRLKAGWKLDKELLQWQIDTMEFVQEGIAGSITGSHVKPLSQQGQPAGTMDMTAHIAEVDVKRIGRYLPLQTPSGLRQWLSSALEEGSARDVAIRVRGELEHFPFRPDKPEGKPKGEFSVTAKIDNGKLNYAPGKFAKNGKDPLWPQAEKIQGSFTIDNARIVVHADTASTAGVGLSGVDAIIPDMMSNDMQLDITGHAEGGLQDFVRYTTLSPVSGWIGNLTEDTRANGNARLLLKMQMPLERMRETKVQGTLQFMNNDVLLLRDLPTLYGANGTLEFWEKGFRLNGIGAQFLGGTATIAGGTQPNGKFQVRANGSVTPEGLTRAYPNAAMQRLAAKMTGSTRFGVEVNDEGDTPDVIVESNLRGLGLDFPAPLGKSANQSLPLRVSVSGLPPHGRRTERDEIRVALGNALTARYLRQKDGRNAPWRVTHGAIGVNMPNASVQEGVALNVNLHALDMDAWQEALEPFSSAAPTAGKNSGDPALDIAQYIEPTGISLLTDEMTVMGTRLGNVRLNGTRQPGNWQAQIRSDQANGQVAWKDAPTKRGTGKLTARLATLMIPQSLVTDASSQLGEQKKPGKIPALDIVADDFTLLSKRLGRLVLVADNIPGASGSEWRIDNLHIANPDGDMKATGSWFTNRKGVHSTSLNYVLEIANAGKLLERFGYDNVLRRGKGRMQGAVSWNGVPYSIDYPSLSGKLELDVASGQFLQVEPGVARLLGVLSLQTLPRRLALDFRDVFSQGFAFDGINATATIANGVAHTDNLKMRGASATVLMDGSADIVKETQNLHIVVLPEINAGAASVAYGLINPAVGLGTFLAQLFLRDPLMRAFTYEYQVTGSWTEPSVKRLPRNTGYVREEPKP